MHFNVPTSSRQLCGENSLRRDEVAALLLGGRFQKQFFLEGAGRHAGKLLACDPACVTSPRTLSPAMYNIYFLRLHRLHQPSTREVTIRHEEA